LSDPVSWGQTGLFAPPTRDGQSTGFHGNCLL
jgi:hypothetical protein